MLNLLFLESVTDFFISKLSMKPIFDFFGNLLFDGDAYKGALVFYGLVIVLLIIIIIICACVSNSKAKKKKAKMAATQQAPDEKLEKDITANEEQIEDTKEEPIVEQTTEEVKEEQPTNVSEEPIENVKEDQVIEEKQIEEIVSNKTKEETTIEDVKETPTNEVKEETPAEDSKENVEDKQSVLEEVVILPTEEKTEDKKSAKKSTSKQTTKKEVITEETKKPTTTKTKKSKEPAKEEVKQTPVNAEEKTEDKKPETLGKYAISEEGINWRYRLYASNGQLLLVSELYTSEESCRKGIATIKQYAKEENINIVKDKHDLFSFRVVTNQGRYLATSASYKAKDRAVSASKSFIKFAQAEKIINVEAEDHFEVEEFKGDVTPEKYGKFRFENVDDEIVFKLYASNGRVIAVSQPYASKKYCLEALEKFRTLAYDGIFYIFKDKNAQFQFKLYNKQKRLVLAGEVYKDKQNAISVITSIKKFAKLAEIVEDQPQEEAKK